MTARALNTMVYNRCVGTRYCSNNCPYKVRRFNFGPYARDEHRPPESRNPDVTVRARGVMEKCSFCVQRIAESRGSPTTGTASPEQVTTACQAACPTQAFSFGDLSDPAYRRGRSPQAQPARLRPAGGPATPIPGSPTRLGSATPTRRFRS